MYQDYADSLSHCTQLIAMALITLTATGLLGTAALSAAGVLPWIAFEMRYGDQALPWAGPALQIGLGILLLLLLAFLPSARRVLRLEASHRNFDVSMDDVIRAYRLAHNEDRAGAFALRGEFDSIRDRYNFLRDHPDLAEIDAELLTIAAQMSQQSRDLAEVYSEEKVERVNAALSARKQDSAALQETIQTAHAHFRDIRHRLDDVEMDEAMVASQLSMLREEMAEITARCRKAGIGAVGERKVRSVAGGVIPAE